VMYISRMFFLFSHTLHYFDISDICGNQEDTSV
jgi:hypothetical protein